MGTTSTTAEQAAFAKVLKQATEYEKSTGKKMTAKQAQDAMDIHLKNPNLGVATSQKQKSTPNIKGQTNEYGQTYLGNNKFTGQGYAYVDKYGYSHVVKDYDNALNASGDGKVYSYNGDFSGGYAYDNNGYRVPLNIEGSKPYGNDVAKGRGYSSIPDGVYSPTDGNGNTISSKFSGQIGGIAKTPAQNISSINSKILNQSNSKLNNINEEPWQQALERYKTDYNAGIAEITRAGQVYNEKKATGDIEGAEKAHAWANQIRNAMGVTNQYDLTTGAKLNSNGDNNSTNQTNINEVNSDAYTQQMQDFIAQQEQAYIQQQQAQLEMERDNKIAELEVAYERQVAEGKKSVREAQTELEEQKEEINKSYYEASQKLGLYANNMGIQNSQQMLGLMQSDVYRKGELTNDAMSDYNKRVADIRDRINGLMLEKDIAISNANSAYNSGMLGVTGTAKLNSSNQMFSLYQTEHQNEVAQQQAIENALLESKLRIEEMVKSGEINAQQAQVAFEREKQLLAIKYGYDVSLTNMSRSSSDDSSDMDGIYMAAAKLGVKESEYPDKNSFIKAVYDAQDAYDRKMRNQQMKDELIIKTTMEDEIAKAQNIINKGKTTTIYSPSITPVNESKLLFKSSYLDAINRKKQQEYDYYSDMLNLGS